MALVAVLIAFVVPIFFVGRLVDLEAGEYSPASVALAFGFYVVSCSVAFFFNHGARRRRDDSSRVAGDPTARRSISGEITAP